MGRAVGHCRGKSFVVYDSNKKSLSESKDTVQECMKDCEVSESCAKEILEEEFLETQSYELSCIKAELAKCDLLFLSGVNRAWREWNVEHRIHVTISFQDWLYTIESLENIFITEDSFGRTILMGRQGNDHHQHYEIRAVTEAGVERYNRTGKGVGNKETTADKYTTNLRLRNRLGWT